MTSTSSMSYSTCRSSSFLFTEVAVSLATFGLVTAAYTTLERRRRKGQAGNVIPPSPHHYPYHPPERIVRYLQAHAGKRWIDYSTELEEFVRECPKVELHVHLDGALDADFLWYCLKEYEEKNKGAWIACLPVNTTLPWDAQRPLPVRHLVQKCQTANDFHQLCTCRRGQRSLQNMLTCFEIFLPLVRASPPSLFLLEEVAHDFCRRQWEQNVIYTEVRYCPHLLMNETSQKIISGSYHMDNTMHNNENDHNNRDHPKDRLESARQVVQAVTRGLRRGCAEFGIVVNQILCAINWRPDLAWDVLELAEQFRGEHPCGVVGIDIAAGEEHYDAANHPELYQAHFDMMRQAQTRGIPVAIHAGETPNGLEHVRRAVATHEDAENPGYGAKRIGHGYRTIDSVDLMRQLARAKIHVEICPTSSVETGGWMLEPMKSNQATKHKKPWKDHPGLVMMQHGIPISLNSDDPAVFHTSLTWQYRIALVKMGLTPEQLVRTNIDAIEASFGRAAEKKRIQKELKAYLEGMFTRDRSTYSIDTNMRFTDRVRDPFSMA